MRSKIIIASVVGGLLLLGIYGIAWVESVVKSQRFYRDSLALYNQGDLIDALKGVEKPIDGEYVFLGGVQQVVAAWESPLAWPKPGIYKKATKLLDTIIDQEINTEIGLQIFKQYFQLDRKYLDRILLRVGDLYFEQQEYGRASEVYQNAGDIFVNDEDLQIYTTQRLRELERIQESANSENP